MGRAEGRCATTLPKAGPERLGTGWGRGDAEVDGRWVGVAPWSREK